MAVIQSILLTFGTFIGVMWFFAQLPDVISKWHSKELEKTKREWLFLMHFAPLLWVLYSVQKWDYDWFIPSLLQAFVSLGHLALVYALLHVQTKLVARYALTVPLVLLVLWRACPLALTGAAAAVLQIVAQTAYIRMLADLRASAGSSENSKYSCLMQALQVLVWTIHGYLNSDYFIASAFAVSVLLTTSELLFQVTAPKRRVTKA